MGKKAVFEEVEKAPLAVVKEFRPGEQLVVPGAKSSTKHVTDIQDDPDGKGKGKANKKLKTTPLKKIIMSEREEKKVPAFLPGAIAPSEDISAASATQSTDALAANKPSTGDRSVPLLADVPEFVPFATQAPTRILTRDAATTSSETNRVEPAAAKMQPGASFVPSWCRGPATEPTKVEAAPAFDAVMGDAADTKTAAAPQTSGQPGELPIAQAMQRLREQDPKKKDPKEPSAASGAKTGGGIENDKKKKKERSTSKGC